MQNLVKEVLDYISLHPGVTREEIHEKIGTSIDRYSPLGQRREFEGTFNPATMLNGMIDALIELKIIVVAPSNDIEPIAYGLAQFYLSLNIAYIYGVAFGTTSQVVKIICPICETENLVNPLRNIGKEKTCRDCHATLFPSRILPNQTEPTKPLEKIELTKTPEKTVEKTEEKPKTSRKPRKKKDE